MDVLLFKRVSKIIKFSDNVNTRTLQSNLYIENPFLNISKGKRLSDVIKSGTLEHQKPSQIDPSTCQSIENSLYDKELEDMSVDIIEGNTSHGRNS